MSVLITPKSRVLLRASANFELKSSFGLKRPHSDARSPKVYSNRAHFKRNQNSLSNCHSKQLLDKQSNRNSNANFHRKTNFAPKESNSQPQLKMPQQQTESCARRTSRKFALACNKALFVASLCVLSCATAASAFQTQSQDFEDLNNANALPRTMHSHFKPQSRQASIGRSLDAALLQATPQSQASARQAPLAQQSRVSPQVAPPQAQFGAQSSGHLFAHQLTVNPATSAAVQSAAPVAAPVASSPQAQLQVQQQQTQPQAQPQQVQPQQAGGEAAPSDAEPPVATVSGATGADASQDQADEQNAARDTVFSDQRFASLFARRNVNRKARLSPSEPVKAKPTLPSFIKSSPDPKQVAANAQAAAASDTRPAISATPGSASSAIAAANARLQQSNAAARAQASGKKPASTTRKPLQLPSQAQPQSAKLKASQSSGLSSPKPSSNQLAISNSKAKQQQVGNQASDNQSNVIAMARKRLLANNALESSKLRSQQNSSKLQQ